MHRLVTLTGVGGVGKTRLALEAASAIADEFPEGVWVVELGPVGDPAAVPDAVATALGIVQQPGLSVSESVAAALAGWRRLLVLDNCEHVLDATAELIGAVLARSTTVKVLATSREALQVGDEHAWRVPSLGIGDGAGSDAVTLFVERARAADAGFRAEGPDEGAVVEICRRLDGVPLAIELAASRMVSMSPSEVRDRLHDRFRLLAGPRRGLERHQTLRHAASWSYDLLAPAEQQLLACCSVFAGGFDLAAATATAPGTGRRWDDYAVLDGLDSLVRKSLLAADRVAGRTRYAMLETVRAFAEEQLVASGLAEEARRRHAAFFAGQQDPVLALWDGPLQREAYDWLGAELANLRAAFRWSADSGDLDTAATVAVFASFLGYLSERHEPFTWSEELISAAQGAEHPLLVALFAMAAQCVMSGRRDDGRRFCEAAEALFADPRYSPGPFGCARPWIGRIYLRLYDGDRCIELCRAEIDQARGPGSDARELLVTGLAVAGRDDEARALATDVVTAAEGRTNPRTVAYALLVFGVAWRDADPTAAMAALRRALEIARNSANARTESNVQIFLADLEVAHGYLQDALDHIESALTTLHDSGDTANLPATLARLAMCLDRLGQHEAAATIAGATAGELLPTVLAQAARRAYLETTALLREGFGAERFDTLAASGAALEPTALFRYALEQIERARAMS
jgi:predicted ATPase